MVNDNIDALLDYDAPEPDTSVKASVMRLLSEILTKQYPPEMEGATSYQLGYLKGLLEFMATPAMERHLRSHLGHLNYKQSEDAAEENAVLRDWARELKEEIAAIKQ
jgi:hypothetical protein